MLHDVFMWHMTTSFFFTLEVFSYCRSEDESSSWVILFLSPKKKKIFSQVRRKVRRETKAKQDVGRYIPYVCFLVQQQHSLCTREYIHITSVALDACLQTLVKNNLSDTTSSFHPGLASSKHFIEFLCSFNYLSLPNNPFAHTRLYLACHDCKSLFSLMSH